MAEIESPTTPQSTEPLNQSPSLERKDDGEDVPTSPASGRPSDATTRLPSDPPATDSGAEVHPPEGIRGNESVELDANAESNTEPGLDVKLKEKNTPEFQLIPPSKPPRFSNLLERQNYSDKRQIYIANKFFYEEEVRSVNFERERQGSVSHALFLACGSFPAGKRPLPKKRMPLVASLLSEVLKYNNSPDSVKCSKKRTALHHAIRGRCGDDSVGVIGALLEGGSEVDLVDVTGRTALIMACERGREGWIEQGDNVGISGTKLNANDEVGGKDESVENEKVENKVPPPHYGAIVADLLVRNGASINYQDSTKSTAVHHAVRRNDLPLLESLLRHSPDLSLVNSSGLTPTFLAATMSHNACLKTLVKAGASV